ncbi:MAG: P-loop NTPase family protein [Acidiferrobacterales bacterium]
MSKIEEALRQAQSMRRSKGSRPESAAGRALVRTPGSEVAELEKRGHARDEIARMADTDRISGQDLAEGRIIFPDMRDNRTVDAFRELRTKLIQKGGSENMVLMVTSVTAGDGATFVARNLAVSFAFDEGKTALLIDCNLRNPGLMKKSGTEIQRGLTDYLEAADMPVEKIIYQVGIPRLRLIPSGARREIASEYFTSLKMRRLLEALKARYAERYVVLDAPAVTESADSRILAELADYVLLVVPYGRVSESQILAAAKAIGAKKLVGIVFNNEPRTLNPFRDLWPWAGSLPGISWLAGLFRHRAGA